MSLKSVWSLTFQYTQEAQVSTYKYIVISVQNSNIVHQITLWLLFASQITSYPYIFLYKLL